MGFVEEQTLVQKKTYGVDARDLRGDERAQYLRDNVLALTEELHELMRESSWKFWKRGQPGYGEPDHGISVGPGGESLGHRERVIAEMGDVMAFLGNLARLHDLTTDDLIAGHRAKLKLNSQRHADQAELRPRVS